MNNPYSFISMLFRWMFLGFRLFIRLLAKVGPIADWIDKKITPIEYRRIES